MKMQVQVQGWAWGVCGSGQTQNPEAANDSGALPPRLHFSKHSLMRHAAVDWAPWPLPPYLAGLMIHAAIDGVALGASIFSGSSSVTSIIFLAIMLHKGACPLSFVRCLVGCATMPPGLSAILSFFLL